MGILIYTESDNGKFKKSALELASYGRAIADQLGVKLIAVSFNQIDYQTLGTYGVERVIQISDPKLENFIAERYAANLASVVKENGVKLVLLSSSANAKYLAPLLAISISAGYASNVVGLPGRGWSNFHLRQHSKKFHYYLLQKFSILSKAQNW